MLTGGDGLVPWAGGRAASPDQDRQGQGGGALIAASEIAGSITMLVLVVWLVTWGVTAVTD